jgi:hypothetical protein
MNHASFRLLRCLQGSGMVNLPDSWTFAISILSGKYTLRYIHSRARPTGILSSYAKRKYSVEKSVEGKIFFSRSSLGIV